MTPMKTVERLSRSLFAGALLVAAAGVVHAGPPLICHPVQIDGAATLPSNETDWRADRTDYDVRRLVDDTLGFLGPRTPVLVRMETLRRATVLGKRDSKALARLLAALDARLAESARLGRPDPIALFDVGYLVETIKQFRLRSPIPGAHRDGYAMVERAIEIGPRDPEMEFAAAAISWHPRREGHERHLRAALDGAPDGSLLARNLVAQFGHGKRSLAELRADASR